MLQMKKLEKRDARLYAPFADFDSEPVISIDPEGRVIHTNCSSNPLYSLPDLLGRNSTEFIHFPFDIREFIQNDRSVHFSDYISNRYYSVYFRGISDLQVGEIFLHDVTEAKINEEKLIDSVRRQKEIADILREKMELERQTLAGRIYDEVNQNLSVVRLKLQKLSTLHDNTCNTDSEEYLKAISLLENTINVLKDISYHLKPKILDEVGLAPAINGLCTEISRQSGIKGSVNIVQTDNNMDKKCVTYLFRIIQEALNNVVMHSRATEFSVQLIENEKFTRVFLSDNGIGFDPEKIKTDDLNKGLGLLNIKERTEALNGKLKIDSFLNKGTVIIVEVPKQAGLVHA